MRKMNGSADMVNIITPVKWNHMLPGIMTHSITGRQRPLEGLSQAPMSDQWTVYASFIMYMYTGSAL